MGDVELGELRDVPIRDVWDHEAHDFTPWLAENLHRLGTDGHGSNGRPV